MDTTTFLLIVITLVAITLVAVGVYLIIVLVEARKSLRRFNKIMYHADSLLEVVDEKIARPASSLASALGVVKELVEVVKEFKKGRRENERES